MTDGDDTRDAGGGLDSLAAGSTDSRTVESHYDAWAATYDQDLQEWEYAAPAAAAKALAAKLTPGADVLDVGCGTGLFGAALAAALKCRLEGIDISAASLELAGGRGVYDRLHRHNLQATPLPAATGAFDAAACIGVMTYIAEPARLLADLCRIVRPGGYIYFTHRDDRWAADNFGAVLDALTERGLWASELQTDARPYLPRNDEFEDRIKVIHALFRTV